MERLLPRSAYGYGQFDRAGNPYRSGPVRFVVNHVIAGPTGRAASLYGWFVQSGLSTHFYVRRDGLIEQYVPLLAAAYGQGVTSAGSDFPAGYPGSGSAYNNQALSIEREGQPWEEPTPIQWARLVALNRWLADGADGTYPPIPLDGDHIVGHYRTDWRNRASCPHVDGPRYMARLLKAMEDLWP